MSLRTAFHAGMLLGLILCANLAYGQEFPSRPIRMIVPYTVGGLPDVIARMVGQKVSESVGQAVVIENVPGSGGIGGTELVIKAAPDGYTLLVTDGSQITVNPHLYSKLSYDPFQALVGVSLLGSAPLFMTVNASSQVKSLPDLIALAKSISSKLNYGTPGTGSVPHLASESFKVAVGGNFQHIPYKGSGPVVQALLAGDITFGMFALSSISAQANAGKARLLAISAPNRSQQTPDIPTFGEFGIADFDFQPRIGIAAPARTPGPIVSRLATELAKAVKNPDTVKRFTAASIDPVGSTPEAYATILRADFARYGRIVKISGAKAD